jgi:trimethylamine--corrinoid protein Co-methyltransferase
MLRHYLRGIEVNKNTLAIDVIQQVGPGGSYLTSIHTVKNLRKELYISKMWERGQPSMLSETALLERAAARVEEILTSHHPLAISSDCVKEMKAIWRKAGLEERLADTLGPVATS